MSIFKDLLKTGLFGGAQGRKSDGNFFLDVFVLILTHRV